jgi:L-threonylcarbamoyladenylate synthase
MTIKKLSEISFDEIIKVLKNSGLVVLPFDTCYGICCDPYDQKAVDKLLAYKARREGKAISISVTDINMASKFVEINDTAKSFYDRFLPGPFTVISKSKHVLAKGLEAENGTQAVRIPDHKWILDLIKAYDHPITSTSANQSYQKTPYKIEDLLDNSSKKHLELIDLIVDAGGLDYNPPSTVIDTTLGDLQVIRKGSFLPEGTKVNELITLSEEETINFGEKLLQDFEKNLSFRPLIFALQGDLGAGKTQFTKGVAKALGITERVQSPTFILSREYDTKDRNKLFHIDTWRLEKEEDLKDIGFEDMLKKSAKSEFYNVVVIEWADKFLEYLRRLDTNLKMIWIEIGSDSENENKRTIKWSE